MTECLPLPLYDSTAICKKCGCTTVSTQHYDAEDGASRRIKLMPVDRETREHLRRQCTRCGFSWNERPLDSMVLPKPVVFRWAGPPERDATIDTHPH